MHDTVRLAFLPGWYALMYLGLIAVYVAYPASPLVVTVAWVAHVALVFGTMIVAETFAPKWFADHGHADAAYLRFQDERLRHGIGHLFRLRAGLDGFVCWILCGLSTVALVSWAGASLRASSAPLGSFADIVSALPAPVRILGGWLLLDAWSYCRHRLEHANDETGLLWRFVHRRHHAPIEMNLWHGSIVHPLESVLVFALPSFVLACLGFATWELNFVFTLFLLTALPQHLNSGFPAGVVGAILQGPEAHTRHHTVDRAGRRLNLGDCFTFWDRLFGTWQRPESSVFPGPFGVTAPDATDRPGAPT